MNLIYSLHPNKSPTLTHKGEDINTWRTEDTCQSSMVKELGPESQVPNS